MSSNNVERTGVVSNVISDFFGNCTMGSGGTTLNISGMRYHTSLEKQLIRQQQRSSSLSPSEVSVDIKLASTSGLSESSLSLPERTSRYSPSEQELTEEVSGVDSQTRQPMKQSPSCADPQKSSSERTTKHGSIDSLNQVPLEKSSENFSNLGMPVEECQLVRVLVLLPNQRAEVEVCNMTQSVMDFGLLLPPGLSLPKLDEFGIPLDFHLKKPCRHYLDKEWLQSWNPCKLINPNEKLQITIQNIYSSEIEIVLHSYVDPSTISWECSVENATDAAISKRLAALLTVEDGFECVDMGTQSETNNADFNCQYVASVNDIGCQTEEIREAVGDICPSMAHVNATWRTVVVDGVKNCHLSVDTVLKPAYGGPSARYGIKNDGYDENDRRSYKVVSFMNKKDSGIKLEYIDYELFWHLRRMVLFMPFSAKTLQNLRVESNKFFGQWRTSHLDTAAVTMITEATCLAAAMPPVSSLKIARAALTYNKAKTNAKYRELLDDGVVKPAWWQFWRSDALLFDKTQ